MGKAVTLEGLPGQGPPALPFLLPLPLLILPNPTSLFAPTPKYPRLFHFRASCSFFHLECPSLIYDPCPSPCCSEFFSSFKLQLTCDLCYPFSSWSDPPKLHIGFPSSAPGMSGKSLRGSQAGSVCAQLLTARLCDLERVYSPLGGYFHLCGMGEVTSTGQTVT